MTQDDEVVERLDRLIALLTIVHGDAISRQREELAADPVNAAIMAEVDGAWVPSGELQRRVSKSTKVAPRTVLRAITGLSGRRLLLSRGSGKSIAYRSSGVL